MTGDRGALAIFSCALAIRRFSGQRGPLGRHLRGTAGMPTTPVLNSVKRNLLSDVLERRATSTVNVSIRSSSSSRFGPRNAARSLTRQ